jgi:type III effector protein AvrRpm1
MRKPRAASRTANSNDRGYETDSEPSRDNLLPNAKRVYSESVLWHGTSMQSKIDLRSKGFDADRKKGGATEGGNANMFMNLSSEAQAESRQNHYVSSSRKEAKDFAMFADMSNPGLVRTIGLRSNFNLISDPRTCGTALMTDQSIHRKFVLGSKSSAPGENAKVFRDEMHAAGYDVSTKQAGKLLREVQSDSDDDNFPDPDDFIMSRFRG